MNSEKVFDIRFLYYMQELDLSAVIAEKDDISVFSDNLQSFIDKVPGFVTFLKDPANHRNTTSFTTGISVLKRVLTQIGCKFIMLNIVSLEAAVRNRSVDNRDNLVELISRDLERICQRLKNIPQVPKTAETITGIFGEFNKAEETRKKTIMVVDDSVLYLNAVEQTLNEWFNVYTLQNAKDYDSLLEKIMVDLFLLDVEMPSLDGYQLLDAIRNKPAYKTTPIIFITGHATPENLELAKSKNISGFVRKPFSEDILVERCCRIIAEAKPREYILTSKTV